jgi:phage terminase large subunit-like protein
MGEVTPDSIEVDQFVADALLRVGIGEVPPEAADPVPDICDWAEQHFYIIETGRPIVLADHQKIILRLMTEQVQRGMQWVFRWQTCLYSTIKKSGKTTISAIVARWAAETWGSFQDVYNLGNNLKQAQDRAFKMVKRSIVLGPPEKQAEWAILEKKLTHIPSGSVIEALPVNDEGEAGGNQSLTIWTELWGFQYEDALRFWDELQPVLTRPRSLRFVDTYAGYEGESELLKSVWNLVLNDDGSVAKDAIKLHAELPIYGNADAGLIAYIDQGIDARRMPWQQGDVGRTYYQLREANERPASFRRIHLNEWVSSQNALFNPAMWDRLAEKPYQPKKEDVIVGGVDASVSGDSMALVVVAYRKQHVYVVERWIWEPDGEKLDYAETLKPALRDVLKRYPVVSIAYDPYQLHDVMTQMAKEFNRVEFYEFSQGEERLKADTAFVTRVRQGTFHHPGDEKMDEHARNADGKEVKDGSAIRIVKRAPEKKIDLIIATSQGSYRATELGDTPTKSGFKSAKTRR